MMARRRLHVGEAGGAPVTQNVCLVYGTELASDGYCGRCEGYHAPPDFHACRACGGPVDTSGYCDRCRESGGGVGYRMRELPDGRPMVYRIRCEMPERCPLAQPDDRQRRHWHLVEVWECIGITVWPSWEDSKRMLLEFRRTVSEVSGAPVTR